MRVIGSFFHSGSQLFLAQAGSLGSHWIIKKMEYFLKQDKIWLTASALSLIVGSFFALITFFTKKIEASSVATNISKDVSRDFY